MKSFRGFREEVPAILVVAVFIVFWQIAAVVIDIPHILPAPTDIIMRLWELRESLFQQHLPATMLTVFCGWGLAIVIGLLLAVMMYVSPAVEAMLHPALVVTQTVPMICISPLFVLWFGYTLPARLLAVVLSTFFAVTLNTFEGFCNADYRKSEWMQTVGANRHTVFLYLNVPSALPNFLTSLKMTLPWAVIDAAVVEWLGATEGLGYFSRRMITKMDGAGVFAPIVILCIVSLLGTALIKHIDRRYVFWRGDI